MDFLGVGLPELLVILVLILIVVGPQRLPQMAAQLARLIRDFRRYTANLSREFTGVLEEFEREYSEAREEWKEMRRGLERDSQAIESQIAGAAKDAQEGLRVELPARPSPSNPQASGQDQPPRVAASSDTAAEREP
jgi:Tat protein translocase TatB subunit